MNTRAPYGPSLAPDARRILHPVAWVTWVAGVVVALTTTRNPWFVGLVLLLIGLVLVQQRRLATGRNHADAPIPTVEIGVIRFAFIVVATSAVFNMLMVHVGEHVLFTLPPAIPLIGGPVTLEALVYGALNGFVLAGLFAAFTVLNRVLPVRALLRLVPRAYYPAAVVMSIAVTFAPSALVQIQQVREAQAVRGHRMTGMRSWLPLLVPLLEGSLERSMQLAEAMMARGFAAGDAMMDRRPQVLLLCGMGAWLSGWLVRLAWGMEIAGWGLLIGGALLLVMGLWLGGRQHPHTVYRPDTWQWRDGVVIGAAILAASVYLVPWPGLDRAPLFYYPYPALIWPEFSLPIAAATLGLGAPLLTGVA
jgi:energy-coupling factor transport system permease protein